MAVKRQRRVRKIPALKVRQWLPEWEDVKFDESTHQAKPDPKHFYLFSLSAAALKALTGIQRRTTEKGKRRHLDLGIQRRHDEDRSEKIWEFVRYGFPWSDLSQTKRASGSYDDLRKPGWLPTAIVVNILNREDERQGEKVAEEDLVSIKDVNGRSALVSLPGGFTGAGWEPKGPHPIEVIDGQHRLWAFEDRDIAPDFELPVVAFYGLGISWQAYLFYTINIKHKRINMSLAFDLYPLLRTEDWLAKFYGHPIYRESRAQELTSALWAHPESPWYHRINMLGERGLKKKMVSQASWVRSLTATYIKPRERRPNRIGGLFGAPPRVQELALPWCSAQQAAFLILMGQELRNAIKGCNDRWAISLRKADEGNLTEEEDPAFVSPYSLLNGDMGIRGVLHVTNDLCIVRAESLRFSEWEPEEGISAQNEKDVSYALSDLKKKKKIVNYLRKVGAALATYDWRTMKFEGLSEEEQKYKARFRGSGGYKELRLDLLNHLKGAKGEIAQIANEVEGIIKDA